MNIGYIRVSTQEQHVARQIEELKKYDIDDRFLFIDKISGTIKASHRKQYEAMKQVLRQGDMLYIHELDRLGRNKDDIVEELRYFKQMGVTVKILDVPTTLLTYSDDASLSQLILEMVNNVIIEVMATLAQAEFSKHKKRKKEGIAAAHQKGVRFGRPPLPMNEAFLTIYERWKRKEITAVEAYHQLGISKSGFYNLIKRYKQSL